MMPLGLKNTKDNLTALALENILYCIKLVGIEKTKELFPQYKSQIEYYEGQEADCGIALDSEDAI